MENPISLNEKLRVNDILNYSLQMYKKNFITFCKHLLYIFIPTIILAIIYYYFFFQSFTEYFEDFYSGLQSANPAFSQTIDNFIKIYTIAILSGLVGGLLFILMNSVLIQLTNQLIQQKPVNTGEIFKKIFKPKTLLIFICTYIISILMCVFGFIFCIIPGLLFTIYLSFTTQAIILDDKSVFSAIGQSFQLTSKCFWQLVLYLLILIVLSYIINLVVMTPLFASNYIKLFSNIIEAEGEMQPEAFQQWGRSMSIPMLISSVISYICYFILFPFYSIIFTVKYLNMRNIIQGASILKNLDEKLKEDNTESKTQSDTFPENN